MTGAKLREQRMAARLTQAERAARAGFDREAVFYWEAKPVVPLRYGAPRRFAEVLDLPELRDFILSSACTWGWRVTDPLQAMIDRLVAAEGTRIKARDAQRRAKARVLCGARTHKGLASRLLSEPGKRRCKFHGGKSTGAKRQKDA
ncbi:hypothetical protein LHP98_12990 [Rhodobacter sp. Har01]|uniref:HGGxSTG domain-containing protein n=1 Tax=Rhodobacter sp. Har01 TaxID=2883999 RepID=UPI001D070CC9|nr:HGGxSTG domain-containing protein [Rhodobacter sp. Har01]MCB6179040.1 hypothetical protein [Rhodobacter sp. Har01]